MAMANGDPVLQLPGDPALNAAVQEAAASLDAGKSVPYADVRAWLLSWGTKQELPKPE